MVYRAQEVFILVTPQTGQGEGANRLHLGRLQSDADGDDLWLAIEYGIGRNPSAGGRKTARTPKGWLKTG